jgi:flagellar biosynthesis protein FlhB
VAEDKSQRSEPATPKRKRENRQKGQVARSQTLVAWVTLLVATWVLPAIATRIAGALASGVRAVGDITAEPSVEQLQQLGAATARAAFGALLPLLVLSAGLALLISVAQVGFILTFGPLTPKWERVSPKAGIKRIFSTRSLWETGKQVLLVAIMAGLAMPALETIASTLSGTAWPLSTGLSVATGSVVSLTRTIAVIGVAAGVLDWGYQRWNLNREQRMTKEEVKKEHKDTEGDPHIKAKLRSLRTAMSRNGMLAAAAEADVVITNPTHVAVALTYDPGRGAPRVVASGSGHLALRIRERAAVAGVPRIEAPPLARALHRTCAVDDEIPAELFTAVATVLAFVHRVGARRLGGAGTVLDVPDTWTPPGGDPAAALEDHRRRRRRRPRPRRRATAPNPQTAR